MKSLPYAYTASLRYDFERTNAKLFAFAIGSVAMRIKGYA